MSTFAFRSAGLTHQGLRRTNNEDGFLVRPDLGVWAVADGMGGHFGGEVASETVVRFLASAGNAASAPDLLARFEDRIVGANAELRALAHEHGVEVIGTTVAALLIHQDHYACVWSGDSRIYLLRAGVLTQLSRDHTELQEMLDKGLLSETDRSNWPARNAITRAIGVDDNPELELSQGRIETGDTFILCTDGLFSHVADEEIADIAATAEPDLACQNLIALTLDRGATDNVTVILMSVSGSTAR